MADEQPRRDLDGFFAAVVPYLRGETTVDRFFATLGPSTSPRERVEIYPWLVRGDLERIIDDVFPTLRAACEQSRPDLYAELKRRYADRRPPSHFELYRWGEGLADFVCAIAGAEGLPSYLEEIADFHYTRYRILTADVEPSEQRLDLTLHVRQYAFETPDFVAAAERGRVDGPPRSGAKVYLHYRSLIDGSARWMVPTTPMLLAVARFAQPTAAPAALVASVSDGDLDLARASLRDRGVLP